MKLTGKRFWILLIVMAYASVASAQTVFSVEKISETEYIKRLFNNICENTGWCIFA